MQEKLENIYIVTDLLSFWKFVNFETANAKGLCHQMVSTVKKKHRKCACLQKVAYYSRHDVDFW